jgi:hypothetical protein
MKKKTMKGRNQEMKEFSVDELKYVEDQPE